MSVILTLCLWAFEAQRTEEEWEEGVPHPSGERVSGDGAEEEEETSDESRHKGGGEEAVAPVSTANQHF